jgi:poly(3-hydroxybutyrate) depolymerase
MRVLLLAASASIGLACSSPTDRAEVAETDAPQPDALLDAEPIEVASDAGEDAVAPQAEAGDDADPPPADAPPGDGPAPTRSRGCTSGTERSDGPATIRVGGRDRRYVLRRPTSVATDRAWPLVLALHPNGSNAGYFDVATGGRAIRPLVKDHAILVLPEAVAGDWRRDLDDDLAYFDALIESVQADLCVDTARVFAMGFSGGGSFSGVLGCMRTDVRAIAAGGAVIYFDRSKCVGRPAAWITIGDGERVDARTQFRDFWVARNDCTSRTSPAKPAAGCVAYACPDPARPTEFCAHPGGHDWPSFGAEAAWAFFSRL